VNRNYNPARWLRAKVGLAILGSCLLASHEADAEVTVAKGETWDAYVAGRVGAFASYAFGQGRPIPKVANSTIEPGAGVDNDDPTHDTIYDQHDETGLQPAKDATGNPLAQGKLNKLRVRSGFYPNILTIGAHKTFGPQLELTAQVSIWGTIESVYAKDLMPPNRNRANGGRENSVEADFHEGFLRLEGNWGEVNGGRFLSLYGRGLTEIDALYGHGYGVGFPMVSHSYIAPITGDLTYQGPTGGMTGFGVLSATHAAGITYTTPNLSGLKVSAGIFDPATYIMAHWGRTTVPRVEGEITYDLRREGLLVHVFGSGGFQPLRTSSDSSSTWGAMGGGRLEVGPVHIGVGGFLGKASGINYAFDDNPALSSSTSMRGVSMTDAMGVTTTSMVKSYELRNTRGFVGMVQIALGKLDIGGGYGQTVVLQVDADRANAGTVSTLKTQTGITAAVVYHMNESLHLDLDFMNGAYKWYNGESEKLNMLNGGVTVTF
jgi:hypothetical protein